MAKNIKLRIKVEFVETEEEPSKVQRQAERLKAGAELREQATGYRVEGEVGRFGFALYEAVDVAGEVVCRGEACFPKRQPREWHKTEGFREEAVCWEASKRSYRDNTAHLNRYRRQEQGGTPVTTLQDNAQKEGARVLDFLERHSQSVLQEHGFTEQSQPKAVAAAGADRRLEADEVEQELTAVCEEMEQRGFSPAEIAAARRRGDWFEPHYPFPRSWPITSVRSNIFSHNTTSNSPKHDMEHTTVWPAPLADGLITWHIIDPILDINRHRGTPVRM